MLRDFLSLIENLNVFRDIGLRESDSVVLQIIPFLIVVHFQILQLIPLLGALALIHYYLGILEFNFCLHNSAIFHLYLFFIATVVFAAILALLLSLLCFPVFYFAFFHNLNLNFL